MLDEAVAADAVLSWRAAVAAGTPLWVSWSCSPGVGVPCLVTCAMCPRIGPGGVGGWQVGDMWELCGSDPKKRFTWDMLRNDNLGFGGGFQPRARYDR